VSVTVTDYRFVCEGRGGASLRSPWTDDVDVALAAGRAWVPGRLDVRLVQS